VKSEPLCTLDSPIEIMPTIILHLHISHTNGAISKQFQYTALGEMNAKAKYEI